MGSWGYGGKEQGHVYAPRPYMSIGNMRSRSWLLVLVRGPRLSPNRFSTSGKPTGNVGNVVFSVK